MRLQANYNGAWRNVLSTVNIPPCPDNQSQAEHLMVLSDQICADARGRRILDEALVVWTWDAKDGWKRPRWHREAA